MNIVKNTQDFLCLSSGLPQYSFSKTDMDSLLKEKSIIVHIDGLNFSEEEYFFDGTKADETGITVFEGKPFKGELLSEILGKTEYSDDDILSLTNFCRAADFLIERHIFTEFILGGGGILIASDSEKSKTNILFINPKIFESCSLNHKENYSDLQGKYIYKGLDSEQAVCFLRGVVAYKALTNHFPFEEKDTTKRQEDIFDKNFIPPELWNEKINKNLAFSIEAALSANVTSQVMAGKRNLTDAKSEYKRRKLLERAKRFDSEEFKKEIQKRTHNNKNQDFDDGSLSEKRENFLKKIRIYLTAKRFVRRNKNRILAGLGAVIVVSWFVSGFLKNNAKLITTKGLSSTETVHALYTQIHRIDVPNLQEVIKGKDTKDLFVKMSGFYVSAKQRLEVSPDNGILTPEKWLFFKRNSKSWMFGITNLKIDGKDFTADADFATKKDKPAPITEENGKILKKGDEVTHTAEYNFVRQAEAKIYIERMTDTVTLRWNGRQWKVIKIDGKAKIDTVKSKDFIEEYYAIAPNEETKGEDSKIRKAMSTLREKYDWLPSDADMKNGATFLFEEYGSVEAEKYLKDTPFSK